MKVAFMVGGLFLASAIPAQAESYASCLLDKLPGSSNSAFFYAVYQACLREHPSGLKGVIQGSGRGLFSYSDGAQCTIKKAAGTTHQQSAQVIGIACRCLYDKKVFDKAGFSPLYCAN